MIHEERRLAEARDRRVPWKLWGPYLSERQWGTVREDYSEYGTAWDYFSHDAARSRAYRWGEDGIGGISDDKQRLCFSVALWNGRDPILKERLFGLTNSDEGNHGEDVKELYYYLDATPTHSYLKMLYKYPQREFPYTQLVEENRRRGKQDPELELLDTGVFDENRYFDVFIEYAKGGVSDLLIQITAVNRGPDDAPLHILPQLWFRNTWSWGLDARKPSIAAGPDGCIEVSHPEMPVYRLYVEGNPECLFCDNESNGPRLWGGAHDGGFYKNGFHEYVIHANNAAVNPQRCGTKAAVHYSWIVPVGSSKTIRVRLTTEAPDAPFDRFERILRKRLAEADEFYSQLQREISSCDERLVQRQALAGMIWSNSFSITTCRNG